MLNSNFTASILLVFTITFIQNNKILAQQKNTTFLVAYANPLMGTDSEKKPVKWKYVSCNSNPFWNEFLDTNDRRNGKWLDL